MAQRYVANTNADIVDEPLIGTATWLTPHQVAEQYPYENGAVWLGRNVDDEQSRVGRADDSHVLLCAKTRAAKGRSIIIPNLITWPGSLFCYDPKGENASITALMRGNPSDGPSVQVNKHQGQNVVVLDAHRTASVPDALRGYFNPLAELEPNDPATPSRVAIIAESCVAKESRTDTTWDEKAETFIKILALHISSSKFVPGDQRDLITLRRFIVAGDVIALEHVRAHLSPEELEAKPPDPFEMLILAMRQNTAYGNIIADQAESYLGSLKSQPKLWNSIRTSAEQHTAWIDDPQLRACLRLSEDGPQRTFRAGDLQSAPEGLSVFLCLPSSQKEPLAAWPRMVTNLILSAAQERGHKEPATGFQTLMMLDEFASLKRMPKIESAAADIAGAGVKLFFVVQSLVQLKNVYGEGWEAFLSSADTHVYYGFNDNFTAEYVSKRLGEIEVIRKMRSGSSAQSQTRSVADQTGGSKGQTLSSTEGVSSSLSAARGGGRASTWGSVSGLNSTTGWGPSLVFRTLERSHQEGRSFSRSRGGSRQKNWTKTKQSGRSSTSGSSTSYSETWSRTLTESEASTNTDGWSEQLHRKPLATVNELMTLFASIDDADNPIHPGIALVSPASGIPFVVHKAFYDRDYAFRGTFEAHPKHGFLALPPPPKRYGPEHFQTLALKLEEGAVQVKLRDGLAPGDLIQKGQDFLSVVVGDDELDQFKAPCDALISYNFPHYLRARLDDEVIAFDDYEDCAQFQAEHPEAVMENETRIVELRLEEPVSKEAWKKMILPLLESAILGQDIWRANRELGKAVVDEELSAGYFHNKWPNPALFRKNEQTRDLERLEEVRFRLDQARNTRRALGYDHVRAGRND
ncbi:MAG: type IV secretory system conjugative DNA transfer family protein [Pseudomonadota bacterium]